ESFGVGGKSQTARNDPVNVCDAPPITDPAVAITAPSGTPILIRFLNGQYFPVEIDFGGILVEPVSSDGRAFLDTANYSGLRGDSLPLARALVDSLPAITPAERDDLILNSPSNPAPAGVYDVAVRFLHWITGDVVGVARTTITIT